MSISILTPQYGSVADKNQPSYWPRFLTSINSNDPRLSYFSRIHRGNPRVLQRLGVMCVQEAEDKDGETSPYSALHYLKIMASFSHLLSSCQPSDPATETNTRPKHTPRRAKHRSSVLHVLWRRIERRGGGWSQHNTLKLYHSWCWVENQIKKTQWRDREKSWIEWWFGPCGTNKNTGLYNDWKMSDYYSYYYMSWIIP